MKKIIVLITLLFITTGCTQNTNNQDAKIKELENKITNLESEKQKATTTIEQVSTSTSTMEQEPEPATSLKQPSATTKNLEPQKKEVSTPTNVAPPNTILCNGKYWDACLNGKKFYCPTTGDAQCLEDTALNQGNTSQAQQQQTQEITTKLTSITNSMNTLTQLKNNCDKSIKDSEAETSRLQGLLSGNDYLGTLDKIYAQESYRRIVLDECVSKRIRIIDNILVDVKAVLRIPNLPANVSSSMNQTYDSLILERNRLVNWQFQ